MLEIKKLDLLAIIQTEGIELRQRGKNFIGLCPFHQEKTASFSVNTERQRFKCFGCGVSGDVIDLIRQLKGLSFRDSLKYLGITGGDSFRPCPQEVRRIELVKKFNLWCENYSKYLCEILRLCNQVDALFKSPDCFELNGLPGAYFLRDIYQYHLSILDGKDDAMKFKLYKEVRYG